VADPCAQLVVSAPVRLEELVGFSHIARLGGSVLLSLIVAACSGAPDVSQTGDDGGSSGGNAGFGSDGQGADAGDDGTGPIDVNPSGGTNGNGCKTACEADECGPIADGCGDVIECGGCTAPETCGGGSEPSRCGGASGCTPKTCEDIGATCGMQADGCGEVIDCWSDAAKAGSGEPACENPNHACIDGECKAPPTTCEPLTCDDYSPSEGRCGPVTDGCGGTLDCDFECANGEVCGAVEPGVCGTVSCVPLTCEAALADKPDGYCGYVADGCGGEIEDCATECTGDETCGGGGTPDVCGEGDVTCIRRTIADCADTCGPISDGCGDTIDCGGCSGDETCGGGGEPGVCGAPACEPRSCDDFGANCGTIPDGCGETLPCGSCDSGSICNANVCEAIVCEPATEDEVCPGFCGVQSDGCGGTVDCGGCTGNNTCGGGGTPSVCGAPPCTPLTCEDVGANCGPIGDGCGGVVPSCGTCEDPEICGGGGVASVCGTNSGNGCTGLCQNQVDCSVGNETRLTGTVYAPNGTQPLYNALVYVPNAPLPAITQGASCERCEDEELGSPIAAAITGADGTFVLRDVPAAVSFPLVVKMGKWRRVVTIPPVAACSNVNLSVDQTRLPRNMTDATAENRPHLNIPRMAMVTGDVDELECVLRKIGISDSEFTLPSGNGRIHLYRANGAHAACTRYRDNNRECRSDSSVNAPLSQLFSNDRLDDYDVAIFGCEGDDNEHDAYDPTLRAWANRGGRVFASHYSYTYLHDNGNFADTATWGGPHMDNDNPAVGIIDTSFSKGAAFNEWLGHVDANHQTHGSGFIEITDPRDYVRSVASSSERFVYTDDSYRIDGDLIDEQDSVQQYSFNTPVGANADNVCGRVLYSAFHVANASDNNDEVFPLHCSNSALTPQEKVLEFMLFDLSACVSVGEPPGPPSCTPKTCASLGANCGYAADGCGGLLDCGTCEAPDTCGGAGVSNQCGNGCTQTTCGAQGANCGIIGDGCGATLDCGDCTDPAICGGGGTASVCGTPTCTPRSCADVNAQCGAIADGCGGTVNCGTCTSGTCGGGGTPNVCGTGSCNPKTCASEGANCGFIGDGCGGTVSCGTCPNGQVCGAAGPNVCGGACVPRTCGSAGANCGFIGDGCGGVLNCGTCQQPQVCGGGGVPSQCGGSCTPRTCAQAGAECGAISDGCGGVLQCGSCPSGSSCGGAGVPNQCGTGTCPPKSCAQANANCGAVGDGCGNVLNCGTCMAPQSCGGGGVPNQCGNGGCVPRTCAQQGANCGPVADGCGGLLDCGTCAVGQTCGGGGTPSQCGSIR
jgi:hypothetical protein